MNTNELLGKLETLKNLENQIQTREKEIRIEKINDAYNEFMDKWGEDIEALKIVHKNGMFLKEDKEGKKFLHGYGEVWKDRKHLKFYFSDRKYWCLNMDSDFHNIFFYKNTDHGEKGTKECLLKLKQADEMMPLLIKSAEEGIAYYENQLSERLAKLGGTK